jgi:NADP-dependent 3-hydroxy acid dehydrogenase YdfG
LVVTARRQSKLDELIAEIREAGGEAVAVVGDVRDEALANELVETATRRFGGLDVAFNTRGLWVKWRRLRMCHSPVGAIPWIPI